MIQSRRPEPAFTWRDATPRQRQIIELVCDGLTSVQIAERLGISPRTVEAHRFNLMRRLQVRNVAGLLRWAIADGLDARVRMRR
jgi:DNA-binding NarL/FixJ family response regulator